MSGGEVVIIVVVRRDEPLTVVIKRENEMKWEKEITDTQICFSDFFDLTHPALISIIIIFPFSRVAPITSIIITSI